MHALVSINHKCHTYSMVSNCLKCKEKGRITSLVINHHISGGTTRKVKENQICLLAKGITVVCIEQNRLARAARCCAELV